MTTESRPSSSCALCDRENKINCAAAKTSLGTRVIEAVPASQFASWGLARAKSGGKVWYYLEAGINTDGKRKETPLGSDYIEALRRYAELVSTAKAPPVTAPELLTRWHSETIQGRAVNTQKDIGYAIPKLIEFFSSPSPAPLNEIKPQHVSRYLAWRKAAPIRANREIAWLSTAWNWGRTIGLTDLENPCNGVKRNKETGRDIYPEDDEIAAIEAHADEPLKEAMRLAYLTGQRPGDLRDMQETDIRGGVLTFSQNKTGAKMAVSVVGELEELINRIRSRKSSIQGVRSLALLCDENGQPLGKSQLRHRFDRARSAAANAASDAATAARIMNIQFRDLRAKAGTDKREIDGLDGAQRLLGHAQSSMTEHYTRARRGVTVKPVK